MRIMALDVGDRRIGVAVSDDAGTHATPLVTLQRRGGDADRRAIADLVRQRDAELLVVGLPIDASGGEGIQARRTREFVERLTPALSTPIELIDERYSTVEGAELLRRGGRGLRGADVDSAAAAVILQRFLETHHGGSW
jgi:putative Holliday junction resolvase